METNHEQKPRPGEEKGRTINIPPDTDLNNGLPPEPAPPPIPDFLPMEDDIFDNLPPLLGVACSRFTDSKERETFLIGALGVLSGMLKHTEPLQRSANMRRAEQLVATLEHLGKDITQGYNEWFALGCCLAATFGEEGRDLFHRASGMHPKYHPKEADTQYTQCLRFTEANNSTAGLGYLVNRCKQVGVDVSGRAA